MTTASAPLSAAGQRWLWLPAPGSWRCYARLAALGLGVAGLVRTVAVR